MNKKEMIDAIARKTNTQKSAAEEMLNATLEVFGQALKKDKKIVLVGFGSFTATRRPSRRGRNPQTGKEIVISAKTVVKFKAGKALEEKLNN